MDRLLDTAKSGPSALRRPEIARMVAAAILEGDTGFQRYRLHTYVVMPNHVHMLATPSVPSRSWLGPLKGFTAHEANRILGTVGSRFWQDESDDHLVRDGEFERIRRYIEWNPVRPVSRRTRRRFHGAAPRKATPPEKAAAARIGCPTQCHGSPNGRDGLLPLHAGRPPR